MSFLLHSTKHMDNSQETKLAYEIASALDDIDSLEMHLSFARTYKEEILREKLQKVMSIPEHQIKRSRAALYTFLVKQHGKHRRNYPRD